MFWTFLLLFIWIAWIVVLFRVIFDIFRSRDLGGFAKALWVIFVIILPFLGVLVYLIARGHSMTDATTKRPSLKNRHSSPMCAAPPAAVADQPTSSPSLSTSRDKGVITDAEFQQQKAKLLA